MKLPNLDTTAEFNGVSKSTLIRWKTPETIEGVKFHRPFGKHNLYKGARLAAYLFSHDLQNEEEMEWENNFEKIKETVDELKEIVKEKKLSPLLNFIKAVEKIEFELVKENKNE